MKSLIKTLLYLCIILTLSFPVQGDVNFKKVDWTDYLGAKHSFIIKNVGIPDRIYPKRYSDDAREDDVIFHYRGAGVDMRMYLWRNSVYRMHFSKAHKFNIFKGVRAKMKKEQIESILGTVSKVTETNLYLWKQGGIKLIVDFDKKGKAKEILLSLDEK